MVNVCFCLLLSTVVGFSSITGLNGEECKITNCKSCGDGRSCQECTEGYYLQSAANHSTCKQCSKNCTTCTNQTHCISCEDGYYIGHYRDNDTQPQTTDCRLKCRKRCPTCISFNNCTSCKPGRYGDSCKGRCDSCLNSTCHKNGTCIACADGKFGNMCEKNCIQNCINCDTITGTCSKCVEGYFGNGCKYLCDKCSYKNDCKSNQRCSKCKAGYYGEHCENNCPIGCKNNRCDKTIGRCENGCTDSTFGDYCNQTCSTMCKDTKCNDTDGICYSCPNGFYGDLCQNHCSDGCDDSKGCNKSTGKCSTCIKNKYGPYCNVTCSQRCKDDCYRNGNCIKCEFGYYGGKCDTKCPKHCLECLSETECSTCIDGYFGDICNNNCSIGCRENKCDNVTGNCRPCNEGYSGSTCEACQQNFFKDGKTCNRCPQHCRSCRNGTHCLSCDAGYWGNNCTKYCLTHTCKNNICTQTKGVCVACNNGSRYGELCHKQCPVNCKSNTCVIDGHCINCKSGFYGKMCNDNCSENCAANACGQDTGSCSPCKAGYYGNTCNKKCPINCIACKDEYECTQCKDGFHGKNCSLNCSINCSRNCSKKDGQCIYCVPGQTGDHCDQKCDKRCQACARSDKRYCKSCVNDEFWETKCVNECPNNCLNGKCKFNNGECRDGCKTGFRAKFCNCPENCLCSHNENYNRYRLLKCSKCINESYDDVHKNCECSKKMCKAENCKSCKDDRFYPNNRLYCCPCSSNCKDGKCSSANMCTHGCVNGFYGDHCNWQCSHRDTKCKTCNNTGSSQKRFQCLDCTNGSYPGQNGRCTVCKECKDSNCDSQTGICRSACIYGYWGGKCDQICQPNCDGCDGNTGKCLRCLRHKWFGDFCNITCSDNCTDSECMREHGQCAKGCRLNRYGPYCENPCQGTCQDGLAGETKCNETDGYCVHGCLTGFYGSICKNECDSNCLNTTCKQNSGVCAYGCRAGFQQDVTSCAVVSQSSQVVSMSADVITGTGVALGLLFVVSVIVAILIKRHRKKNEERRQGAAIDLNSQGNVSPDNSNGVDSNVPFSSDDSTYGNNPMELQKMKVPVENLEQFVSEKSPAYFVSVFWQFPNGLTKSYGVSQHPDNAGKNRYKGVYPYDDYRVKVQGGDTDYINASFVDGYKRRHAYIASIGPTVKHMVDFGVFWRMVWQEKVEKIVMLTNLVEDRAPKCDQYWPELEQTKTYSVISVSCVREETLADFTIRTFTLSKDGAHRQLSHYHFTSWPDKGTPDDGVALVEFRRRIVSAHSIHGGPILVHCSAGIGRTGTYIGLDILTNEGEGEGRVDFSGCVMNMRQSRPNMIQTPDQYIFLHKVVLDALTPKNAPISGEQIQSYLDDNDVITKQLRLIQNDSTYGTRSPSEQEAVEKNTQLTSKNRPESNIPGDIYRPRLFLNRVQGSSDYINAVYVNSYKRVSAYLLTQTPLPDTVEDFLCLVVQEKCCAIVSLVSDTVNTQADVGTYLPEKEGVFYSGLYSVRSSEPRETVYGVSRLLHISNDGTHGPKHRPVFHVSYTDWNGQTNVPNSPELFLQFINDIAEATRESVEDGPILIHCLDGGSKSGLLCVVSVLLQKMEIEHEASVVNTVRQVKARRRNAVCNEEQFRFCYICLQSFVGSYVVYSNCPMRTKSVR